MNVRLLPLCFLLAISVLTSLPAAAHDPAEFDRQMTVLPVAKDCAQLVDPHYAADPSNADIKALKERCDAETSTNQNKDPQPAKDE
jgi:hypothetical protein